MKLKYVETHTTKLNGKVKLQWKGFWLLTIYFDLGKPNTKGFQSMFSLNQLHFREIFLIRFACKIQIAKFKGRTGKPDIDLWLQLGNKCKVWTWNLAFCSSNIGLILSQNVLKVCLTYRQRGILQARYTLLSMVKFSIIWPKNPFPSFIDRAPLICHQKQNVPDGSVGWAWLTVTTTQRCNSNTLSH